MAARLRGYGMRVKQSSTWRDVRSSSEGVPPRWGQRIGLVILTLVVLAGAFGLFGVHSRQTTASHDGYDLTVTYPQVARAGWDAPWRVHVHHIGGFGTGLTIAVSMSYFRMWETQGFFPNPDSAGNDGRLYTMTFNHPSGSDFELEYDAYIQPSAQIGKNATVEVIVNSQVVVATRIHTWLVP